MNPYKVYLNEKNLSHCTLYPNVSDVFPITLKSENFINCCKLEKLPETAGLNIDPLIWKELSLCFNSEDICLCFSDAVLLIQSWDVISDPYQKLDLSRVFLANELNLDIFSSGDIILKGLPDFPFYDSDRDIPWKQSHIFLLSCNWDSLPQSLSNSYWLLKLDKKEQVSDWEINYILSFSIVCNEIIKMKIPLYFNSLDDNRFRQGAVEWF